VGESHKEREYSRINKCDGYAKEKRFIKLEDV